MYSVHVHVHVHDHVLLDVGCSRPRELWFSIYSQYVHIHVHMHVHVQAQQGGRSAEDWTEMRE